MKTPQDFMPPRLKASLANDLLPSGEKIIAQIQFDTWYDTHIVKAYERAEMTDVLDGDCIGVVMHITPLEQAVPKKELVDVLLAEAQSESREDRREFFKEYAKRIEKWGVR